MLFTSLPLACCRCLSRLSVSELKREVSLDLPSNISQKTIDSAQKSGVQRDS